MKIIRPMAVTDAALVDCDVPENDYPEWSAGTTYGAGARVLVPAVHRCYESYAAGNVGINPPTDKTKWLDLGPSNRWRQFDRSIGTQTTRADSLTTKVRTSGRTDALALLNTSAREVDLTITHPVDGVVFPTKTYSMVSTAGISNFYSWFMEPVERKTDLLITGLPPYSGAEVTITLRDPGATVALGVLALGLTKTIGGTRWGYSVGIQDFSKKERDRWGGFDVEEGEYASRGRFQLQVERSQIDAVKNLLARYRATPVIYIGDEEVSASFLYGFYKDFEILVPYPTTADCSIEIESVT